MGGGLLKPTQTSLILRFRLHKEVLHGYTISKVCKKSISITPFCSGVVALPFSADLLFSLKLKIKPRTSALKVKYCALLPAHSLTSVCVVRSMIKLFKRF